ncbi:hypothetical protein SISSUDRAFT_1128222 [Sistotremastrum suecicum HHB10207 ss-3]|uniref:Ricin B lectin domain-containing protein n=1 Tax=Sistotremastrum suecicum HHB10207 ss-3 TaxID=1314776 RepID=A0A166E774_9AGAM|nr:hypothetical protein SISSUDRAFT_1128222 [Sistotremastrum suecicum HHB10207 ss-3]
MLSSLLPVVLSSLVLAAPASLHQRDVPISICNTTLTGLLAANASSNPLAFSIDDQSQLVFNASSNEVLNVAFQPCTPNFGHFNTTGNDTVEGHIFLPDLQQCLGVASLEGPTLQLAAVDCPISDDSSQGFVSWVQTNGSFLFAGVTQADGSIIQGTNLPGAANCTGFGFFGFPSTASGVPADGPVTLECANNADVSPFLFAPSLSS